MVFIGVGEFVVVSVIVIGCDQESSLWINWFFIEGQVFNMFCLWMDYLIFVVVVGWLSDVDLVVYFVNDVEVVGVEVVLVDQ